MKPRLLVIAVALVVAALAVIGMLRHPENPLILGGRQIPVGSQR
jgi:hypothetical protein